MASTTTSDSEDFESADEDIEEETARPKPMLDPRPIPVSASIGIKVDVDVPIPSLQSNCQKEPDKQNNRHSGDVKKPAIQEPGGQKFESGSGDLPSKQENILPIDKPEFPSKMVNAVTKDIVTVESEDSATGNDEPPIERRRRQQKQREPKTTAASKKLGTKITASTKTEDSITKQPENTESQTSTEADPYAKFKGYSKPPMMQRCWVTGPDGKAILDNHESKMPSHEDVKATGNLNPPTDKEDKPTGTIEAVPDPYAKFRGYSEPPLREQCWEDDVDDVDVIDDVATGAVEDNIRTTSENMAPMFDKLSQATADKAAPSSWGGWGNWGVTSLLTSATESVSTLTSHVTSVLESGIGAPNPEELARIDRLEEKLMAEMKSPEAQREEEKDGGIFGLGQLMTSVSKLVETTGSKVLSGGLDTLETIGKKTMEVLQDGDPGLKKKRALFTDKTVLSQILREAKEKAEIEDKETEDQQAKRNVHFETLFDDFQGLVHLEALEMLSKQCDMKLQALLLSLNGTALTALQGKLQRVKDSCQLPDDEDMNEEEDEQGDDWQEKLVAAEKGLGVPLSTGKLVTIWKETSDWLTSSSGSEGETGASVREIHQKAVATLARLTAVSVEQFHKGAEMLLVKDKRNSTLEAEALITITTVLCCQASSAASRFCELLNDSKDSSTPDHVNSLITNIFLEASNSSSYIQEAFQLLVPVLQVGSTA